MKMKAHGKEKILEIGDIVEAKEMDSFTYDQEDKEDHCSSANQESCEDTFKFIPLSSW